MNVDLHCHSIISDGLLHPAEVVTRAHLRGVDMLALTDHDETSGLAEARDAANRVGLRLIAGVEISVSWNHDTVHIIGLNVNPDVQPLSDGLARIRQTRDSRAVKIGESLAAAGIPDALKGALDYVRNPALISRAHFARFLVEKGYAPDFKAVFERFLVSGRPGYIQHQWATLAEAVEWIRASGGIAVIAHPGRYRLTKEEMRQFIIRFSELGGEAIEVVSGAHTSHECLEYAALARKYGLFASRASDFHGPGESRVDLGSLPPLASDLIPVWRHW